MGKYVIQVCTNISCLLCDCEAIMAHLQKRLGIKPGETTPDRKFTLLEVECLASCGTAPVVQINDDYHENLTVEKLDQILDLPELMETLDFLPAGGCSAGGGGQRGMAAACLLFGALSDPVPRRAGRCLSAARSALHRGRPGDRLRRRHHGAVPARHHAARSLFPGDPADKKKSLRYLAWILGATAMLLLVPLLRSYDPARAPQNPLPASGRGRRPWRASRKSCSTTTCCPFEMTSVLILIAIIGAVVLAKRRDIGGPWSIYHYLILSALLFAIGTVGVIVKKNIICDFPLHRTDAERRQPELRGIFPISRSGARTDICLLCHGGRSGGGGRWSGHHHRALPQSQDAERR